MQRIQILNLYRAKLKVCRSIGYSYGNWNHSYLYDYRNITMSNINKLIQCNLLAPFIWNNVRIEYKRNKRKKDMECINEAINTGFSMLKRINYLRVLNNRKNILPSELRFTNENDEYYEIEEEWDEDWDEDLDEYWEDGWEEK